MTGSNGAASATELPSLLVVVAVVFVPVDGGDAVADLIAFALALGFVSVAEVVVNLLA